MKNKSMEFRISSCRRMSNKSKDKRGQSNQRGNPVFSGTSTNFFNSKFALPSFSPEKPGNKSIQQSQMLSSGRKQKLNLSSRSWCLYDRKSCKYTGFRQNSRREIASITKIMTTIISLQFIRSNEIPADLSVKVTESASKHPGTTAELKPNTWINVWDLLYGAMLPSGNDAAFLLAEVVGYWSEHKTDLEQSKINKIIDLTNMHTNLFVGDFISMMNKKAERLHLTSTNFSNPHGLQDARNLSTAKDLIQLSVYAADNEAFVRIMGTYRHRYLVYDEAPVLGGQVVEKRRWWNTNQLLPQGWSGLKTGQTPTAGSCLSSVRESIFIVVLNCKDSEARFNQTRELYQWHTT